MHLYFLCAFVTAANQPRQRGPRGIDWRYRRRGSCAGRWRKKERGMKGGEERGFSHQFLVGSQVHRAFRWEPMRLYTCSNQLAATSPWTRPLEAAARPQTTGSSPGGRDQGARSKEEAAAGRTISPPSQSRSQNQE